MIPPIDRLLRGISTDHAETVRDSWRDLLQDGAASVPKIRQKLASPAWSENPRGPLARYFGVLLQLLDELDPQAFKEEILRLHSMELHPMHAKTLDLLSQRIFEEPAAYVKQDVPVFVASDIPDRTEVINTIKTWCETKGLSLKRVSRINVISRQPELDYLGLYNIFYSNIILTWPLVPATGLKKWWLRLDAEFTFYHEVGHHVAGHTEGGQVAVQECEADAYARQMMRNARPVLARLGRMCLWLVPNSTKAKFPRVGAAQVDK